MGLTGFAGLGTGMIVFLVLLIIWESIWKAIGLWKSARHGQMAWFVCIIIFNTVGILPIVYILFFQRKEEPKKAKK